MLYEAAFENLKLILKSCSKDFKGPTKVVTDFEVGLRNGIQKAFPETVMDGCYFHCSKALWMTAAKLGLKKKSELENTKHLIALMKCIIHMRQEAKQDFWKDVCDLFKPKGSSYEAFLKYFQKNWLDSYSVEFRSATSEELRMRSNNASESFNSKLNRSIGVKNPLIGMLVDKLLDFELEYRMTHLEHIDSGLQHIRPEITKESYLPFTQMFELLERSKPEIHRYNLRSLCLQKEFWTELDKVTHECYRYFFENKLLDELEEKEPKSGKNII